MTLPPFPPQDLAKLVLGYLAEEQLMTAYDEFLQASPYLDALRNEYDRIFMTSLKSILAQYRAVKIYLETCKPFFLRKKLFQCTNLLDVVKFLVSHVDVNKLQMQEAAERINLEKQNASISSKQKCEACNSLKLNCVCKTKESAVLEASLESSVETTSLADLPGSHKTTRKKQVLDKEPTLPIQDVNSTQQDLSKPNVPQNEDSNEAADTENTSPCLNLTTKAPDTESKEKIEEFNNILKKVCNSKKTLPNTLQNIASKPSNVGTFQEFVSGFGGGDHLNTVPDSSTTENITLQNPSENTPTSTAQGHTRSQYLLKVGAVPNVPASNPNVTHKHSARRKKEEQKIQILSDIKFDNTSEGPKFIATGLSNSTSTPMMQLQTIVINGTPAYTHRPVVRSDRTFTKDEIMAMPTLIVVPASGPPHPQTNAKSQINKNPNIITAPVSADPVLGPISVDVSSPSLAGTNQNLVNTTVTNSNNTQITNNTESTISLDSANNTDNDLNKDVANKEKNIDPRTLDPDTKKADDNNLPETDDMIRNATVPKDSVTSSAQSSTPHILPPKRKSSSTPRRSSHIRVLDFTTPRRILHETINEQVPNENNESEEVIISRSPQVALESINVDNINNSVPINKEDNSIISNISSKENESNKKVRNKKNNWDSDLRALIVSNAADTSKSSQKPKPKTYKKKKSTNNSTNKSKNEAESKKEKKKISPKAENTPAVEDVEDDDCQVIAVENIASVPVKPTINIIPSNKWATKVVQEEVKENEALNKSDSQEHNDTPEMDRISLHNAIGAKLNISDLLETPYKQALYDIQMETPRFLGPDIPDDPISDVKIMNIPTPRFLNNPERVTPSSYSSRPTDYSSGGSYYKPDEQDYVPIPEANYPVTSTLQDNNAASIEKENENKKSRPVRQCTKNVLYYNTPNANKTKQMGDKADVESSSSDTVNLDVTLEEKTDENVKPKTVKERKKRSNSSTDNKKRNTTKNEKPNSKTFMKIKPRRVTPPKRDPKRSLGRPKKNKTDSPNVNTLKSQTRKRTTSKSKSVNVVAPAPSKSRRKSSTPRKLNCTETFNSESSGHNSPVTSNVKQDNTNSTNLTKDLLGHDSESEQIALRWSDDGSRDSKQKEVRSTSVNDCEDISQIREYIETTVLFKTTMNSNEGNLQADLIKRGFDIETAKIIERDLLDPSPQTVENEAHKVVGAETKADEIFQKTLESDPSLQIDEEIEEDIEFSIHECTEESENYIVIRHNYSENVPKNEPFKLKDKFSMEMCLEDVTIRLRATPFSVVLDQEPHDDETELAVRSICNIDRLYTPIKDPVKAQFYEIFDSTLTSLDTPLKVNSPKRDVTVTQIVLDEDSKDKVEAKKRKRLQSSDGPDCSSSESKKAKPNTQYLFDSANIQNIDIESVLTKLHGP